MYTKLSHPQSRAGIAESAAFQAAEGCNSSNRFSKIQVANGATTNRSTLHQACEWGLLYIEG